jgi:hypothetical protein
MDPGGFHPRGNPLVAEWETGNPIGVGRRLKLIASPADQESEAGASPSRSIPSPRREPETVAVARLELAPRPSFFEPAVLEAILS